MANKRQFLSSIRLHDQYDFSDPHDAKRAIKNFIYYVEQDRPISNTILTFIAEGLQRQYEKGDITAWTGKKSGRPSIPANDFLDMLVWHRFHLDSRFNKLPKSVENGRNVALAEYFQQAAKYIKHIKPNEEEWNTNEQYYAEYRTLLFTEHPNGLYAMDSESSIQRAVKTFQTYGLRCDPSSGDACFLGNEYTLEVFYKLILGVSADEYILQMQETLDTWNQQKKSQK